MTKDKALHAWFARFLPAYPASSVPGDAVFPWLTYDLILGAWDSGEASITVNLWYYTERSYPKCKGTGDCGRYWNGRRFCFLRRGRDLAETRHSVVSGD